MGINNVSKDGKQLENVGEDRSTVDTERGTVDLPGFQSHAHAHASGSLFLGPYRYSEE